MSEYIPLKVLLAVVVAHTTCLRQQVTLSQTVTQIARLVSKLPVQSGEPIVVALEAI